MQRLFIRYKNKFADGADKEWSYTDVTGWRDCVKEYVQEHIESEHNWSEHYRGCEYHVLHNPPKAWLEAAIASAKNRRAGLQKTIEDYEELIRKKNRNGNQEEQSTQTKKAAHTS